MLTFVANIFCITTIVSPWIYAFGPPHGYPPHADLVSAPNLFGVLSDQSYSILYGIPISLILGLVSFLLSLTFEADGLKGKILLSTFLVGAFLLVSIPNFVFGNLYEQRQSFIVNGEPVAYSIALGPGSRIASIASLLYFVSFVVCILRE
jgi:hypothetical protein